MKWINHGERDLLNDRWVHVTSADVELPDGRHLDHRIIRTSGPGACAVVVQNQHVLLIWRHRFITDAYGWELPHGSIRAGEDPAHAAAREAEEETGWRPGPMRHLLTVHPSPGIMTSQHLVFRADSAEHIGPPRDGFESDRVEWVLVSELQGLVEKGHIVAGTSLAALMYLVVTDAARPTSQ
ncbi:NUDIX hydrolase [Longispora fulva]|uniref:8-oxo-dGTP pyrophosphatase MutT (NUDIX family) n=1 Tax=Longispora fulva TaxID=619741 RepID=A0A8J7KMG6_9ACTN|nr:NUDIX domain-containing protein [Longispora fulva]MBG6140464.1 8-oxo-dGTP pyrophosphatase MutT (NUDIX family) [Longispora fulva]GIG57154.1 NUDIX hydrolase [Longispora fulva]